MGGRVQKSASSKLSEASGYAGREVDALISDWSIAGYLWLRPASLGDGSAAEIAEAEHLDAWASAGSYDGTLYRGVAVDDTTLKKLTKGTEINQLGLSSWSSSYNVAHSFADISADSGGGKNRVLFVMNGTRKGRSIADQSSLSESEVLVSAQSSQVITKKRRERGIITIYVDEV